MEGGLGDKVYRLLETRPRVLVNSLLESRAKWKEKCGVSKVELQAFRGKVRDLEISREKWRIQAEENEKLRRDLAQPLELAQAQNKQLEERLAASEAEEKKAASVIESTHVPGQHYSLEQISFVIQELILDACTGFRAASRVVESVAKTFGLDWIAPDHTTCRAWLLRIGLFQLQRPKEMGVDWIWIVDHTVQIGEEKCLVILGLRLRDMPAFIPFT